MATTTIEVYDADKKRIEYYKGVFGLSNNFETIKMMLDRAGYATLEDIERLRKVKGVTE